MSIAELIERAEQKDPDAMWELAESYYWGDDAEENKDKAFELFTELETLRPNEAKLQNRLGECYLNGFGVATDIEKAMSYFEAADESDYSDACFNLGAIFRDEEFIPHDYQKAIRYLEKGVNLGNDKAMVMLGDMYHTGEGVEKDDETACRYYKEAVARNNPVACHRMGLQALNGWGVPKDSQAAIKYWEKGAEDFCLCQMILGMIYKTNVYVPRNLDKSLYMFERAAEQGMVEAHLELGKIYLTGFSIIQPNKPKAVEHLKAAADAHSIEAMVLLGDYYYHEGCKYLMFSKHVETSKNALAMKYIEATEDLDEACKWYEEVANRNNSLHAVYRARESYTLLAQYHMMLGRQNEYLYNSARRYWEQAIKYSNRLLSIASNENANIDDPDLFKEVKQTAFREHESIEYNLAACNFILKRYEDALRILKGCQTMKSRILSGVAFFYYATENEFGEIYRRLSIIEKLGDYLTADKSYEEEHILSIGTFLLAEMYREGLPGVLQSNLEKAYGILSTVRQNVNGDNIEYLQQEMDHYKKKIFGGFTYKE